MNHNYRKMKIIISLFLFLGLSINSSIGQTNAKKGKIQVYQVESDQMIIANKSSSFFVDCYWVETDETEGKVILNFEGIKHPTPPKAAYLILNIPNVQDASSVSGVIVNKGDKKIGSLSDVKADTYIQISLDFSELTAPKITLTLAGGGDDGLAISSKASGFGALLQFEY